MPFGVNTWTNSLHKVVDPANRPGGFYVEEVTIAYGSGLTKDYSLVPGGQLIVHCLSPGNHTWATSTFNGSARLTVTAWTTTVTERQKGTTLQIYALNTVEPTYGVMCINDAGQRLFSTVYPSPHLIFASAITWQSTTTGIGAGYNKAIYWSSNFNTPTGSTMVGGDYMVFLALPDNTNDHWWRAYVSGGGTATQGKVVVECMYPSGEASAPTAVPSVHVFYVRNLVSLSTNNSHGIRVFDNSSPQKIMFDSGRRHMMIKELPTNISYPNPPSAGANSSSSSFALSSFSGNVAVRVPSYDYQIWVQNGGATSTWSYPYAGFMRRSGGNLLSRTMQDGARVFWDAIIINQSFTHGMNSDLVVPVIDTTFYS